MKKCLTILCLATICLVLTPQTSFAFVLFGYSFADDAFSDDANLLSGKVNYFGFSKWGYPVSGDDSLDLPVAFNGDDLYTGVEGAPEPNDNLSASFWSADVYFKDNYLFNGIGADLIVFERGQAAEAFKIALYDPQNNLFTNEIFFTPSFKGNLAEIVDVSREVNTADIDFSLWGLPSDFQTNRIRIISDSHSQPPDIAAFGGLNSKSAVPEPTTMFLFGSGLLGFYWKKRRSN